MVCRKVQVARPRISTSGGQFAGRVSGTAGAPFEPYARAAIAAAVDFAFEVLMPACCEVEAVGDVGFQCRNAVQILHGLPSGPKTMPGGSLPPSFDEDDEGAGSGMMFDGEWLVFDDERDVFDVVVVGRNDQLARRVRVFGPSAVSPEKE